MAIETHNMTKAEKALHLLDGIDAPLLKTQRLTLLTLADEYNEHADDEAVETYQALMGLINLTDAIADFLADELDKPECLLTDGEDES